jgi:glucan biosynthesis protein C
MTTLLLPPPATRRYDLDWLRVGAFGLLIFYHIGMFYVTWDWHVKSPYASPQLEPIMSLINPWRLPLLFFISGVAIKYAMDKTTLRESLPRRLWRLLLPILFGFFVICAPQAYYELLYKGETPPGFLAFWWQYLDFDFEFSILTPTWNHLWYVVYILVYTLVIAALLSILRWIETRAELAFGWLSEGRSWRLLIVPVLPFIAYAALLGEFPETHALYDDWHNHANSFSVLLYGWFAAKSPGFWRAVERALPPAIAMAVTGALVLLAIRFSGAGQSGLGEDLRDLVRMFYAWAVLISLCGLGQRYLNRKGKVLTYLTEAIFPYYILHQTLIVCIGAWMIPSGLPLWAEVGFVTGGTIAGCVLGYELVIRRIPILRPLFGLPWRERSAPAEQAIRQQRVLRA